MSKHSRACPKCGQVVEWTRGEPVDTTLPNGEVTKVIPLSLHCPKHGPFDNVSHRVNDEMTRVLTNLRGDL